MVADALPRPDRSAPDRSERASRAQASTSEAAPSPRASAKRSRGGKRSGDRDRRPAAERINWRDSVAIGLPEAGRLVRGVRIPAEAGAFFTWDPIRKRQPNRQWRRWGTDVLVRTVLAIARDFAREHPAAPRIGIGDLSRPEGGDFGPQWGGIGHASHQNGLDVDVYYPLRSGKERAPLKVSEVHMRLAQDLVDRFVAAGAVKVFVGPSTPLTGPPDIVQKLTNHDNHLHARFAP